MKRSISLSLCVISTVLLISTLCSCFSEAGTQTQNGNDSNEPDNQNTSVQYQVNYIEYVERYADEYGVDRALIYAVIKCESNFRADARSSVGAMGLMQMMPATFKDMQKRLKEEHDDSALFDPEVSIKYGTYYLKYLYNYFDDWDLVVPAYNAGMGNVSKWLKNQEYSKDGKLIVIPFKETERYVLKVNTALAEYKKILSEDK